MVAPSLLGMVQMNERLGVSADWSAARVRCLSLWLSAGIVWFLLGMQLSPSSKLYHQGLILLAWLPGIVGLLLFPTIRQAWDRGLLVALVIVTAWAALSLGWGGEERRFKVLLYVLLAANAWVALAALDPLLLWRSVANSALLGGLAAWVSLVDMYVFEGNPWQVRAVGTGHLDHTILASHVMGALGVLLVFVRSDLAPTLRRWAWLPACIGYLAFLLMSRSKGPLLAAVCAFAFAALCRPSRLLIAGLAMALALIGAAAVLMPDVVLRGGLSYRPQLLASAYEYLQLAPWIGQGLGAEYLLPVAGLPIEFEHAHNLYLHLAIQLGVIGLVLWLALQAVVLAQAIRRRSTPRGLALCSLMAFAGVSLFTDGMGPWVKPREEWFTVWLPLFLCLGLLAEKCTAPAGYRAVSVGNR